MKYDIGTYFKFEMYLWPGVEQLSQVKSVKCVNNCSIANKFLYNTELRTF